MSPFMGDPIGFNPATLALLDAALTDMFADFELAKVSATVAKLATPPLVSEIVIRGIAPPELPASIEAPKRSSIKSATRLHFNDARGWFLR